MKTKHKLIGHKRSEETKKKMSIAKIGKKRKPFSEEWKKKISESNTGKKHSEESKAKMRKSHTGSTGRHWKVKDTSKLKANNARYWLGKTKDEYPQLAKKRNEFSHMWVGDKVKYNGVRNWMLRNYGRATKCENMFCPKTSNFYVWASISGENIRDRKDYFELCKSCSFFDSREKLDILIPA